MRPGHSAPRALRAVSEHAPVPAPRACLAATLGGFSDNTRRAIRSDFGIFDAWCRARRRRCAATWPASPPRTASSATTEARRRAPPFDSPCSACTTPSAAAKPRRSHSLGRCASACSRRPASGSWRAAAGRRSSRGCSAGSSRERGGAGGSPSCSAGSMVRRAAAGRGGSPGCSAGSRDRRAAAAFSSRRRPRRAHTPSGATATGRRHSPRDFLNPLSRHAFLDRDGPETPRPTRAHARAAGRRREGARPQRWCASMGHGGRGGQVRLPGHPLPRGGGRRGEGQ